MRQSWNSNIIEKATGFGKGQGTWSVLVRGGERQQQEGKNSNRWHLKMLHYWEEFQFLGTKLHHNKTEAYKLKQS